MEENKGIIDPAAQDAGVVDVEKELKELRLKLKKLERENRRLQIEMDTIKDMNEQIARTQGFMKKENQRQIFYNTQLLKVSPYLVLMVDEKLKTVMASDVLTQMTDVSLDAVRDGMQLDEVLSKVLEESVLNSLLEKCYSVLENRVSDTFMLNNYFGEEEKIYKVDINFYSSPVEGASGLCILFTDMTEVIEAKERAERADKAKSNFLANMSHEIRTPMNAINGMSEFILRDSTDEEAKKNAAMIKSAAKSLISIINDILDFSKIESGKMEIINDTYSLSSLVNDVATMIRIRLQEKKVGLVVNLDPDTPSRLYGDEVRIKQVMINILNNSVKFTNEGQITFTIKHEWDGKGDCCLHVSISDTGIGIKKEELGKIFESFTQVDTKRNRSIEGTGLGLAISRRLVTMMGGELRVESVYGEGSTFSFDIYNSVIDAEPVGVLADNYDVKLVHEVDKSFQRPNARILVVDDNDMNLKVAAGLLKPYGIVPDLATSGPESLELVKDKKYDIIFMDHMMPKMDGVETMHRMRDMEGGDKWKIIALTANAISGMEAKYVEEGFDGYLAKPIDPATMEDLLKKELPEGSEEILEFGLGDEALEFGPEDDALEFGPGDDALEFGSEENTSGGSDGSGASVKKSTEELLTLLEGLGINTKTGIAHAAGDKEFYLELVSDYVKGFKERSAQLQGFYDSGSLGDYSILVHALKSNSNTLGIEDIGARAKDLEFASRDDDAAFVSSHHDELIEAYRKRTEEIGRIF